MRTLLHYLAVAGLLAWVAVTIRSSMQLDGKSFTDTLKGNAAVVGMWCFFAVMVLRRPRTWGILVGILMLLGVAAMAAAWSGAAAAPHRRELGWGPFLQWAVIPLGTAFCCICQRWLGPARSNPKIPSQSPVGEEDSFHGPS